MTKLDIILRHCAQNDMDFVFDSWMRSFRKAGVNRLIPEDYYKAWQSKRIEQVLKSGSKILIACSADNIDSVLGWLCYTTYDGEPVVHFTYVKSKYRRSGLAKMMFNKAEFTDSIITTSITYITNTCNEADEPFLDRYKVSYLPDLVGNMAE